MEEQYKLDPEEWDEMQVARVINEIRYEQSGIRDLSFSTIAGYGPHAAMPHYEPNNLTNIKIGTTSTLVIDSGGQYLGIKYRILLCYSARKQSRFISKYI